MRLYRCSVSFSLDKPCFCVLNRCTFWFSLDSALIVLFCAKTTFCANSMLSK